MRIKRILAVLTAVLLIAVFSACGKNTVEPDPENKKEIETEKTVQEPEQEETEPEKPEPDSLELLNDNLNSAVSAYSTDGNWAAYVYCLDNGDRASYNDSKMQAASLIKLYIFACVSANRELVDSQGSDTDSLLRSMITASDNWASNVLITRLGKGDSTAGRAKINEYCANHGYSSTHIGRLLLESNAYDDNYTSAGDCVKLLKRAYNGELAGASQLLDLMKQQQRRHKIPARVPSGVTVGNKTGELADVESDAAVIWAERPYILVVMSENISSPGSAQNAIAAISGDIYNYLN